MVNPYRGRRSDAMSKHAVKEEQMSAAGLSEEEIAALEEEDAEGSSEESVAETDGDGAQTDSDSEVPPQALDDESEGAVADPVDGQ